MNDNNVSNYDVLISALVGARDAFVARYVPLAVAADKAEFDARVAKMMTDRLAYNREYAASLAFDHAKATAKATSAANVDFDAYVAKLAQKIEARITVVVELSGNPWNGSKLRVDTDAGPQVWFTRVKQNARYGHNARDGRCTLYLQWPTRRVA